MEHQLLSNKDKSQVKNTYRFFDWAQSQRYRRKLAFESTPTQHQMEQFIAETTLTKASQLKAAYFFFLADKFWSSEGFPFTVFIRKWEDYMTETEMKTDVTCEICHQNLAEYTLWDNTPACIRCTFNYTEVNLAPENSKIEELIVFRKWLSEQKAKYETKEQSPQSVVPQFATD